MRHMPHACVHMHDQQSKSRGFEVQILTHLFWISKEHVLGESRIPALLLETKDQYLAESTVLERPAKLET